MGPGVLFSIGSALSYRQAVVSPEILGRVNATIRFLVIALLPVGGLLGGGLGTLVGVRETLGLVALGLALAPGFVVFSPLRRVREAAELSPCVPASPPPR